MVVVVRVGGDTAGIRKWKRGPNQVYIELRIGLEREVIA